MAVGDIIQLNVNQRLYADTVQNVLYYKINTDPGAGVPEIDLAGIFISQVLAFWEQAVTKEVRFECVQTQHVFPLPVTASFDQFTTLVGDLTGFALPARNAALIQKFNPAVTGKGKKGRVYIAGIDEAEESEGRLRVAAAGRLNTLGGQLTSQLTGAGGGIYDPVWATRQPAAPFAVTGSVDWTNFLLKPIMASQKRRVTPINSFTS